MLNLSSRTLKQLQRWALVSVFSSGSLGVILSILLFLPLPTSPKQNIKQALQTTMIVLIGGTCLASWSTYAVIRRNQVRLQEAAKARSICTSCYYHSNSERLPCAVNPQGPVDNTCSDYQRFEAAEMKTLEIETSDIETSDIETLDIETSEILTPTGPPTGPPTAPPTMTSTDAELTNS